jgi:hypothetical protein
MVTGSLTGTMPVSTSTVAVPMVPWPHIGRHPETSMKTTPTSASGRVEACRMAPDMALWPRGSCIRSVRRSSRWFMTNNRRSAMVAPGSSPTPDVTTRVGMPSVWLSTAPMTRRDRITRGYPSGAEGRRRCAKVCCSKLGLRSPGDGG